MRLLLEPGPVISGGGGGGNGRIAPDAHDLGAWYDYDDSGTWHNAGALGAALDLTIIGDPLSPARRLGVFGDRLLTPTAVGLSNNGCAGLLGAPVPAGIQIQTFTFSCWCVLPQRTGNTNPDALGGVEDSDGWWLAVNPSGYLYAALTLADSSTVRITASGAMDLGTPHHVGLVVDGVGETATLYMDGAQVGQASLTAALTYAVHGPLYVGGLDVAPYCSAGWVGDVRLANVARDASYFSAVWTTRRTA